MADSTPASSASAAIEFLPGFSPVLPKLQTPDESNTRAKDPMREPQTTAAGIGENKWRDDDPKPKHQFKRFFPPAKVDEFQLGDQEYCEPAECSIQHGRDIGDLSGDIRRQADCHAEEKTQAVLPCPMGFQVVFDCHLSLQFHSADRKHSRAAIVD